MDETPNLTVALAREGLARTDAITCRDMPPATRVERLCMRDDETIVVACSSMPSMLWCVAQVGGRASSNAMDEVLQQRSECFLPRFH